MACLAEEAHKVEDLDAAAAREIVAKAQQKVASSTDDVEEACSLIFSFPHEFPGKKLEHVSLLCVSTP